MTAVAEKVYEPGVYSMDESEYFSADLAMGTLSSSGSKKLLPPSMPAKFDWARRNPQPPRDVFDFGKVAHALVLGDQGARIVPLPYDDWRKKEAQERRDEVRATGATPVLEKDYETAQAMAEAVKAHKLAGPLLSRPGKPEQTIIWRDTSSGVLLRRRLDWLPNVVAGRRLILGEYKTTVCAHRDIFTNHVENYGYLLDLAFSVEAARQAGLDEDPGFVYIAQEKDAPYLVNVISANELDLTIGRNLMRIAINVFAECTKTGDWYGFNRDGQPDQLDHRDWFVRKHGEEPES